MFVVLTFRGRMALRVRRQTIRAPFMADIVRSGRQARPQSGTGANRIGKESLVGLLHRHDRDDATRYQMREKLFAIGDDFWIENQDGERVFKVDGKALRVRSTFILKDAGGEDLYKIQHKDLHIRDTMEVERDGETAATVKKALISPLHDRFTIKLDGEGELSAHGNVVEHEFKIERDGEQVAEVSKRWFRVRESYGVEIAPGEDQALILAVTVCVDEMAGR
jgi:uncharacterized protein YxjI